MGVIVMNFLLFLFLMIFLEVIFIYNKYNSHKETVIKIMNVLIWLNGIAILMYIIPIVRYLFLSS